MYEPFPADGHDLVWTTRAGTDPVELATVRWDNEAWTVINQLRDERGEHVELVLRVSPMWELRQLLVFRDLPEPDLWLGTDGRGRWGEVNGAHRTELDGPRDLVVTGSVFGWTVPIRRLGLDAGDDATVPILVVDPETLGVRVEPVDLARLGDRRWRVGDDEFDVDDHGAPTELGDRVRLSPR